MEYPISILDKDYATPLGTMKRHKEAISLLRKRLGDKPFVADFQQRSEHSVEFQALWLAYLYGENHPLRIVPVTVGDYFQLLTENKLPKDDAENKKIIAALQEVLALGKRPLIIAGVDLAHLGRRFNTEPFSREGLAKLKDLDAAFLERVLVADEKGIFANVHADMDGRHYCGFPPLLLLASILGKTEGKLLDYGADHSDESVVSFAACGLW
jgi:AmmeMemoRadiSam system protein B